MKDVNLKLNGIPFNHLQNSMYQIGPEVIVVLLTVLMLQLLPHFLLYQFNSNPIITMSLLLIIVVILLNGKFQMMLMVSQTMFQEKRVQVKIINGIWFNVLLSDSLYVKYS